MWQGSRIVRIYEVNPRNPTLSVASASSAAVEVGGTSKFDLWHRRTSHSEGHTVSTLLKLVTGMLKFPARKYAPCKSCVLGKLKRQRFQLSYWRGKSVLDLIHDDICRLVPTPTLGGAQYYLISVDDMTRYTEVDILRNKSESSDRMNEWMERWRKLYPVPRFRRFRRDRGIELISAEFMTFLVQ